MISKDVEHFRNYHSNRQRENPAPFRIWCHSFGKRRYLRPFQNDKEYPEQEKRRQNEILRKLRHSLRYVGCSCLSQTPIYKHRHTDRRMKATWSKDDIFQNNLIPRSTYPAFQVKPISISPINIRINAISPIESSFLILCQSS